MINAAAARQIAESKASSDKLKHAMKVVEDHILSAVEQGSMSFSCNVDGLASGYSHASPALRQAVARALEENGYSYRELKNHTWFEVRW